MDKFLTEMLRLWLAGNKLARLQAHLRPACGLLEGTHCLKDQDHHPVNIIISIDIAMSDS